MAILTALSGKQTSDSDLRAVLALQKLHLVTRQSPPRAGFLISSWSMEELKALITAPNSRLILAKLGNEVVGYAMLTEIEEFESYYDKPDARFTPHEQVDLAHSLYLYQIASVPSVRGIGRLLIEQAKKIAGSKALIADVLIEPIPNLQSQKFFSINGFRKIGTLTLPSYRDFGQLKSDVLAWKPTVTSLQ